MAKAWNDLGAMGAWNERLQWAAIGLVFLGGVLQVASVVVGRREKTLAALQAHPRNQKVTIGAATVEVFVTSTDDVHTNYMDSGAWFIFGRGSEPMMAMTSSEASATQMGGNRVRWRAVLTLDAKDPSVGKPMAFLADAEFVEVAFFQLRKPSTVEGGVVVVTLNGDIRMEFPVPVQITKSMDTGVQYVIIRDLPALRALLAG